MNPKPDIAAQFATLKAQYARQLPSRIDDVDKALDDYRRAPSGEALSDVHRQLHSLTGATGTFGFPVLSETARQLERRVRHWLDTEHQPGSDELTALDAGCAELGQLAQEICAAADGDAAGAPLASAISANELEARPLLYVVEDDPLAGQELALQLQHFGYDIEVVHSPEALADRVKARRPEAVVMDISFPHHHVSGPEILRKLNKSIAPPLPALFTSSGGDTTTRLSAVRAGGLGYFTKPLDINNLVDRLDLITQRERAAPFRVLIIDDQASVSQLHATILRAAGMSVEILADPLQCMDALAPFRPELVIMDMYMPGCSGLELAQVIRQQSSYTNLPIVFLSSEPDAERQLEAIQSGADEYLTKPVDPRQLVCAVQGRALRYRTLMSLLQRDSLTGLLNHTAVKEALARDLSLAQRNGRPLSLVMLDIDHFKKVNDSYGHPVGDQVIRALARLLKQRLRLGDIVGRYGGEEFVAILPGSTAEQAYKVIDSIRQSFQSLIHQSTQGPFQASFSAGIAEFPQLPSSAALFEQADAALYAAKHAGRNRVHCAEPSS